MERIFTLATRSFRLLSSCAGRRIGGLCLAAVLGLSPLAAAGQQLTVKGSVLDADNNPVIGATVTVKGTTSGTSTGPDGKFTLSANLKPESVLVFAYLGMETLEEQVGARREFNVVLQSDSKVIDEVVVTGFGTFKKTNFTGSSTKVSMDDIQLKGTTDVSRMLEGQVGGVTIQNVSGTFGAAPKVRVRGATSISGENKPLWVIDGVVHEDVVNISNDELTSGDPSTLLGSAVAGLNANDIESIDVLKDAQATALYGARAMNGVVVVTTKRGKEGPVSVNFSSNITLQFKPTYADYDILNSREQMEVYADMDGKGYFPYSLINAANYGVYGKMLTLITTPKEGGGFMLENTTEAKKAFLDRYAYANTDWFDLLFRNSVQQEYAVSLSSGTERSRTYASLSYLNDDGWSIADRVSRYTASMRNDYSLGKKVNVGLQLVGSVRQQEAPGTNSRRTNVVEGGYDRDFDINPYSYALNASRTMTAYDQNGDLEYFRMNYAPFNILNELENNKIKLSMVDVKAQIDLSWKITKGLSYELSSALRYVKSDREHEIHENSNMAMAYRAADNSVIKGRNRFLYSDPDQPNEEAFVVLPDGGMYNRDEDMLVNYNVRNMFKYAFEHKKNSVNAMAGMEIKGANRQKFYNRGYGMMYDYGNLTAYDYMMFKMLQESSTPYYGLSLRRDRFVAFFGNADYTYDRRYVVAATVRMDASNALGKDAKQRYLPTWTVSGKWNVGNEKFMQDQHLFDYLSLRGSYGLTASMPPTSNASATYYASRSTRINASSKETYIDLYQLKNSDLTWEKGYLFNAGLEFGMLKRRLDVVFEFWNRQSFDLIYDIRTPGIGGQINKKANYANMSSHGFDGSISGYPVRGKDFKWRSSFSYGYSTNKITKADYPRRIYDLVLPDGGKIKGYPVGALFSIQYVGLDHYNGMPLMINENGEVAYGVNMQSTNTSYLKYEGPVDPRFTGGFTNTFTYKDFTLNTLITFQGGNKIRLSQDFSGSYNDMTAMPGYFLDRWKNPGDEKYTNVPSIANSATLNLASGLYPYRMYNFTSARVANGDFIRLKTVSLTYNMPAKLVEKIGGIKKLSFSVAGSNLWLIYSDKLLHGQDPEFYKSGGVASPIPRQVTFSLNLGF